VERPQSFNELIEMLFARSWNPDLQRFRSPYAFRGLGSTGHHLSNSLLRLAAGRPSIATLEQSLLRNFSKYAHAQPAPGVDSVWHWLALGQHHGLPTRLIDWTYSPFVALHFTTSHPDEYDRDGIVWCVNFSEANTLLPKRLKAILEEEQSQKFTIDMLAEFKSLKAFDSLTRDPFVLFIEPPSLDTRILNQFALFSLMPDPSARLDTWLDEHPDLCRRVVVPAELKWEVRDKLDQANINERTLFPGLDGLSRWLERYYTPKSPPNR
jgi:FRG domain-containing protein